MKRLMMIFTALMMLCTGALADGALSVSMEATLTNSKELTAEEWLENEESRALMTVSLWRDYCAVTDAEPCPADGLTDSMVALHGESGYLMAVIPVTNGRLSIYYIPITGTASYMWEGGDYDSSYKKEALENHGMMVWMNDPEIITSLLE